LLPTATTTSSVAASRAGDISSAIPPSSLGFQDTQTPTPVSENLPSALNGTDLLAVMTPSLEPTASLSSELPQLTQTPLFSSPMLLPGSASLPSSTSPPSHVPVGVLPIDVPPTITFQGSVPAAVIAAPSALVVLVLVVLSFLYHRQWQRDRRASRVTFDFSQAQEPPSVPTLPPVQYLAGWNDPPVSSGPARDPSADPVLKSDKLTNVPCPPIAISYTRDSDGSSVVFSSDPFADPLVVVSQGGETE
jgi:hypothetical protein